MITTKRLLVWAAEWLVQSLLIVFLLILMIRTGLTPVKDFLTLALTVLIYQSFSGYPITTALSRVFWDKRQLWTYPAFCALLFLIHFEVLNYFFNGNLLSAPLRLIFILAGMSIAFGTALLGAYTLRVCGASYGANPEHTRQIDALNVGE
jgi:hypothetical protein